MLPFRTLTKTHEQERTCIRSRRSLTELGLPLA